MKMQNDEIGNVTGDRTDKKRVNWEKVRDNIFWIAIQLSLIMSICTIVIIFDKMDGTWSVSFPVDETKYVYKYENIVVTVTDKDTDHYFYNTKYKTKVLLPDNDILIFEDKDLFQESRIGDKLEVEIEEKYQGEELLSTTYKVVDRIESKEQ